MISYIEIPEFCPVCGGKVKIQESDSGVLNLFCINPNCSGKLINKLENFCGKKGLDIKGLSKATLSKLVDWDWVKEPADLFTVYCYKKQWYDKPGFGLKSVNNVLGAIDTVREKSKLENFICALGIPHVGKTLSHELIKYFKTYEEFRDAAKNKWDFTQIDGVAYEKASAIWNFDFTEADRVAEFIEEYEVDESVAADSLEGLKFCITGRLSIISNRETLNKMIRDNGGTVVSGVSKNTNYLINNDINSNSTKNQQAKKLNIPIISEKDLLKMIGE